MTVAEYQDLLRIMEAHIISHFVCFLGVLTANTGGKSFSLGSIFLIRFLCQLAGCFGQEGYLQTGSEH